MSYDHFGEIKYAYPKLNLNDKNHKYGKICGNRCKIQEKILGLR